MRARLVVLVAILLLVQLPIAAAGAFDLSQREFALELPPGGMVVADVPVRVNQDGLIYAKLLVTPGNAVNDGTKANGSVENATGWRVSFAARLANDTLQELGTFVESTVSERVPVSLGDELQLIVTVHIPEDAEKGGLRQKVYVAIGYRAEESKRPGSGSGASIEESRAVTLVLTDPAYSPPAPVEAGASEDKPAPGGLAIQSALPRWFMLSVIGLLVIGISVMVGIGIVIVRRRRLATDASKRTPGGNAERVNGADARTASDEPRMRRIPIDGDEPQPGTPPRK